MKFKKLLTILMSTMLIVTSVNPAIIMAYAQETHEKTEVTEDVINNILTYTSEEDEDVIREVKIESEEAFEDDVSLIAEQVKKDKLKSLMNDLNENLSQDLLCAEQVFPFELKLLNEKGRDLSLNQKVKVTLTLSDVKQLKNTILYHKTDEEWEKVSYKTVDAVLDKDKNVVQEGYVEFETESFSAFIFAKENELKEFKEITESEIPAAKDAIKDTKTEESEKSTEHGTRTSKDGLDAVTLYKEAAESKDDAVNVLRKELSFSRKEAKTIANDLFEEDSLPAIKLAEEDVPRQGDGTNIENITAKWLTTDTVDNGDAGFLYYKPEGDSSFDIRLQVNYALSGEHNYEPGDITITIPESIISTRNGKPAGEIILPFPEDPSTKADFNWKIVDGNYVFTNTKRMSAATKGYFQVGIAELVPHTLVDMEVSEYFDAYIEVTTHKGNTIALRSNKLNAQFDTEAKLVNDSVTKRQYGKVERVDASKIPAEQRVNGETEYIVVKWYAWASITANTEYTLDITDTLPQDKQVTADGLKESDIHGFIINATSQDGHTLVKDDVYVGHNSGKTNYYYYETAYPASQFEPNVEYTFHNDIEMTVTEVDPAAEVTNPNVQSEDPQLETADAPSAQTPWSYRLPEWNNPTGHFMVCKNGNDDKVGDNKTHYSGRSGNDLHIWKNKNPIDGWYGVYPSALNDLQDDEDVYLSYTINSIGYTMPWMFNSDSQTTDGELAARKSVNYNLPVTMVTEDTGVRYGRDKLTIFDDYEFVSIEFPNKPYVYTGTPKNINPDGSWTALTAGDGTFEYELDYDYSHYPDITLELYRNGEWSEYATVSWTTGAAKITLKNGTEISGSVVSVPSDTENFRTRVTVQNTLGTNSENIVGQAAIDYDVRPVIKFIDTNAVKTMVEEKFSASHNPSMKVYNSVNMKAYDSTNEEIVSIDKEGYDVLYGYTTDIEVHPSKSAKQSLKDADYVNRQVTVHYSAKVEERSVINDKTTYQQAISDGRMTAETHGFWYDLLPKGMTPDTSSVELRENDKILDVRTIENYKNSGRTLLIVEAKLTPTLSSYSVGDMQYYEDIITISFDAKYGFDALTDYGKTVHNVIAFESGNDFLGTIEGYSGEPDNPNAGNNVSTSLAFKDDNEKTLMTNLDENRDTPSFVYAGTSNTIDIISAARLSLQKDVMVNNDGRWDTGLFASESVTEGGETTYTYNEHSKEENEMVVWEGGIYSYKLRMMPDSATRAKDMIIYDSLETFKAGDGNEKIDEMAANAGATWQGTFLGIDVSQLEEKDCAPVVYYSTIPNLALSDETDPDVGNRANMLFNANGTVNTSVWKEASTFTGDLSSVKAVAVDATKKTDGSPFSLEPLESVVVLINMRAPSDEAARQIIENAGAWGSSAYAYNNAYLTGTTIDIETLDEDGDNFVRKDYTKVGLKEFKYDVKKIWDDGENRDGKRPESVTMHLYADGVDTEKTLTLDEENNWEGSFKHIPYTSPDGTKIRYSVREDDVEFYTKDIAATETSGKITNSYEPERITLNVSKSWVNDTEENRPEYIDVVLYANGKKIQTKRINKANGWKCSFENLYKNENGTPIIYTAKEVFPSGDEKHLSYLANEPNGITLTSATDEETQDTFTNTYNPYGDLYVSKTVENTTNVSREQQFEFTFKFSTIEDEEEVPVFNEYNYDILDENDEVVSSGKISNNNTISIKGGQKIHVKNIDEYVRYSVSEKAEDGFVQAQATNDNGIIVPNTESNASFTNRYSASGRISLEAEKTLNNRELRKYQFRFELYQIIDELGDNGEIIGTTEQLVKTATSASPDVTHIREDGTIEYSHATVTFGALKFTQDDVNIQAQTEKPYRYKIVEINNEKAGYIYDSTAYYVDIAVTDNGDGTLNIVPTYYKEIPDGGNNIIDDLLNNEVPSYEEVDKAEFTNEYQASGSITLRAWKDLDGRTLTDEEFEFELLDENNQVIDTAKNAEDGTITFTAINYTEKDIGRTFIYGIREKAGSDATVNYDKSIYGYAVTVYDNGDGTLSFSQAPATPILENWECEKCRGEKYVVDAEHPYKLYGSMSVNEYSGLPYVTSALSMAGPELHYISRTQRSTSLSPLPGDAHGDLYWSSGTGSGIGEISEAFNVTADILVLTGVYDDLDVISAERNPILNADTVIQQEDGVTTALLDDVFYDFIEYDDYGYLTYYLGKGSVCNECHGMGTAPHIIGWNTEEGELPVFKNTLRDGKLSISKHVTNAQNADPSQEFRFKVKLIGDKVEDKEMHYKVSAAQRGRASRALNSATSGLSAATNNVLQGYENNVEEVAKLDKDESTKTESTEQNVGVVDTPRTKNPILNNIIDKIIPPAYAAEDNSYTVTFDANGGSFDGGAATNDVVYGDIGEPLVKIIKSDNVIDADTATGPFYQSSDTSKTVTIAGASRLEVKVTYRHYSQYSNTPGGGGLYYHLAIFEGTSSSYSNETNRVAYVANSTKTTETYTISGDTTQFWWRNYRSAGSVTNWTGIYAEIIGYDSNGNVITGNSVTSGTYEEPTPNSSAPAHTQFVSWNTEPNGSGTTMDSEAIASLSADTTLYAQYNTVIVAQDTGSNHWWKIYGDGSLIIGTGATADNPYTIPIAPNAQAWPWYSQGYANLVKSISFDGHVNASSNVSRIFSNLPNLTDVNLTGFHSGPTTSMNGLFQDDISLVSINVGDLDFTNTTNLAYFFQGCSSLKTVTGLDGKSFPALTGVNNMFSGCSSLESISISNIDAPLLRSLQRMFGSCTNLETVSLINWNVPALTTMTYMFVEDSSLKNVSFTNIETPDLENMAYMFQNCSALENLDLSSIETDSSFATTYYMFDGCYSLKTLDISSMDTSNATNMGYMFRGCNKLEQISLGEDFSFTGNGLTASNRVATLPTPSGQNPDGLTFTGKWIRDDGECGPFTPIEMRTEYNGSTMAGTWVREVRPPSYTVSFYVENGYDYIGWMNSIENAIDESLTLPKCLFIAYGYDFSHWEDSNGNTYSDEDTIPANTYNDGDYIYLKAVLTPRNTTANMQNGEFEFTLRGGEMATFSDIPAGTAYQVYEETPDGWVLIEQSNVSGTIQPLETSAASFTNKYEPGTATAQFFGTKTLDGQAAEAESFSFTLNETTENASGHVVMLIDGEEQDVELPYTVTVSEGGFIQFPIIKYSIDDIGTHTYEIEEVNPNNDRVDCDTHKEIVTVNVTGDITKLNTETIIDAGGDGRISFANKTRPGILQIKKVGENVTQANKDDEFTFKVTLSNDKGLPLSDDTEVYWYKLDSDGNIVYEESETDTSNQNKSVTRNIKTNKPENIESPVVSQKRSDESETSSDNNENILNLKSIEDDEAETPPISLRASSGTWGTATYEIDDNNNLIFTGSGEITKTWPTSITKTNIVNISTAEGVTISLPQDSRGLFQNCSKLKSIDLSHFNTTGVTNMSYMFNKCTKLATLDVSNFDTSSVTNMQHMFSMTSTCALKSIVGLENWDVSHVEYMQSMFYAGSASSSGTYNPYYYGALTSLNLSGWDLSSVSDMQYMFFGQKALTSLNLSGWHTGQLGSFGVESMFQGCQALTSVDISGIDGSHCGYVNRMFRDCKSLTNIIGISSWDTSGDYIFDEMFYNCAALEQLDLSSFEVSRSVSGQLTAKSMFYGCSNLTTLDLSNFNSNLLSNMNNMFGSCPSLCSVKLGSEWSFRGTGSVTGSDLPSDGMWSRNDFAYGPYAASELSDEYNGSTMAGTWIKLSHYAVYSPSDTTLYFVMSYDAHVNESTGSVQSVNGGTYSGTIYHVNPTLSYSANSRPWQSVKTKATRVVFVDAYKPTNMANWFNGFNQCTSFVWGPLDTSQVTTFNNTFWSVSKLTSLDLTGWDTSSATIMSFMFGGCVKLTSLNVSSFDTSHVTDMRQMFSQLESMEHMNLSNFNTSSVEIMTYMFSGAKKLKTIDGLESWDVSSLTTMAGIFQECSSLTSRGFEQWNIPGITNMFNVFYGCKSLTEIDLSGWNPTNLTDTSDMFWGCTSLEKLDISNLDIRNATQTFSMFSNCPKLSEVHLGNNFAFAPSTLTNPSNPAILPTPTGEIYTGKWIRDDGFGPYTSQELVDSYDDSFAGTWLWEVKSDYGVVLFDANGGVITGTSNRIAATINNPTINLLNEENVNKPHHLLKGWNTKADGTGTHYESGASYAVSMGTSTILYAEWEDTNKRYYTVKHYQQKLDLSGYTQVDTETMEADIGSSVTPTVKTYEGFTSPEPQTIEIPNNDNTIVEYRYDRIIYNVSFDGNGATSGQLENQSIVGGAQTNLSANKFQKEGSIFTGWNTAADGSGESFTDKEAVSGFTTANDDHSIILYAQWMDNPNEALTPASGEIYVTCKAGESIVIPNLPDGTTYTIEEVDMGDGWSQTGIVNENGTIVANETTTATVNNRYSAVGELELKAHKSMPGTSLNGGEYTFILSKYNSSTYRYETIGTATNEATDTSETISTEDGETPNPWYNTAPVTFDKLTFTQDDIGKTYTYRITEQTGEDSSVNYDSSAYYVYVTAKDIGNGMLGFDVEYNDDKEPTFTNTKKSGKLSIDKTVRSTNEDYQNELFDFTIELFNQDGTPVDGTFNARHYGTTSQESREVLHSSNLNDSGEMLQDIGNTGEYDNSEITIPGAESLHVKVTYSTAFDYFEIYGNDTSTPFKSYSYSVDPWDGIFTDEFDISGDTLSVRWLNYHYSIGNGVNPLANYGYYIEVTCEAADYESIEVSHNSTIRLKDGERIVINGLPAGTTYKVTEKPKEDWTLISVQDNEGTIQAGTTSKAHFTNADERIPKTPEGQAQLQAKKTVIGGIIHNEEDYLFELLDENGEIIQSKNVDNAGENNSTITFDPITYTASAAATPIEYEVQAMLMRNGDSAPEIITLNPSDYNITPNGLASNISGTFTWDNTAYADYNRSQVVICVVPTDSQLSEYTQQSIFDMSSTDSVTFTFENLASYHGGQHKYTIREKRGLDDYTSYDTTNYEAIVTVIDSGEGYLQTSTEYRKNDAIVSEAEFVNRKLTDLDIVKKDESTLATIPNARFTIISNNKYLHSDGTFSDEPEEFITGSNGYINLEKIPAGTYTLHETRAPEGYLKAADIVFIVDENGIVVNNESVDEITVLEEPITHDIMIGKTVSGSMGDTNKEFEFEIKFSKITDMRLQYTRKAAIFSNGTSYSGAGSYIPGYNDMTRAQQIAAIKALPLKENGNEILMAVTGSNNAKVTLRETTISSVSGSGSNEGIITIYTYADDNLGVYGFYEVKAYGPKTLVDIDNTPAGAERTATGTYKVNLKHNETITFEDIPYGVWYTVTEKRANQDGYVTSVTTQVGTATASAVVKGVLTDNESISYTNISDGISPTGIETTRLKLFAFMLTAALICVLYLRKKKTNRT